MVNPLEMLRSHVSGCGTSLATLKIRNQSRIMAQAAFLLRHWRVTCANVRWWVSATEMAKVLVAANMVDAESMAGVFVGPFGNQMRTAMEIYDSRAKTFKDMVPPQSGVSVPARVVFLNGQWHLPIFEFHLVEVVIPHMTQAEHFEYWRTSCNGAGAQVAV